MKGSPLSAGDPRAEFIDAACVPLDALHSSGTLERAEAIRAAHPHVATADVHTAAILGDAEHVRRLLAQDPAHATAKQGPRDWDALTHLCFSRYLRLHPVRSQGFVTAARALLEAGASADTGFLSHDQQPPVFECALYGAAGIAHNAELTRLLLEHGADPNDDEVAYHTPESYDNAALEALIATTKLTAESLTCMLLRKHDWHDRDGVALLLGHGADPNAMGRWGWTPLAHAVRRDNGL